MPDLEVIIFNQKLKLSYQENEKQRLVDAVEKLNKNWDKFANLHGKVSDKKIIPSTIKKRGLNVFLINILALGII